jgi:hypothetical protein
VVSRRDIDGSRFDALFIDRAAIDREKAAREVARRTEELAAQRAAARAEAVEFVKAKVAEFSFTPAELGLYK